MQRYNEICMKDFENKELDFTEPDYSLLNEESLNDFNENSECFRENNSIEKGRESAGRGSKYIHDLIVKEQLLAQEEEELINRIYNVVQQVRGTFKDGKRIAYEKILGGIPNETIKDIDKLLLSHTRLVMKLASRISRFSGVSSDDLFQEGYIGMQKAIICFNPNIGAKFSTYAYCWIYRAMKGYAQEKSSDIGFPHRVNAAIGKLRFSTLVDFEDISQDSIEELSKITGINSKIIYKICSLPITSISLSDLDADYFDGFYNTGLDDQVIDRLDFEKKFAQVDDILRTLSSKRRNILDMYFGFHSNNRSYSGREIGKMLNISNARVYDSIKLSINRIRIELGLNSNDT